MRKNQGVGGTILNYFAKPTRRLKTSRMTSFSPKSIHIIFIFSKEKGRRLSVLFHNMKEYKDYD